METIKTYEVTCDNCDSKRVVRLAQSALGTRIDWMEDGEPQNIVSFRERIDGQFGWQCKCGNNDLMTAQEKAEIEDQTAPKPKEVKQILDNLKVQKPRFTVVEL